MCDTQKNPNENGLGISSVCIVAGLVGVNHLLGNPLTESQLIHFAARIECHPDNITSALLGGLTTCTYACLLGKTGSPKELLFCVIVPDTSLSSEMAREILPKTVSYHDAVFNLSRAVLLTLSLLHGKYENLKIASEHLLHQPYRFPLIRVAEEIRVLCEQLGGDAFYLSGAGSTLTTIVRKELPFLSKSCKRGCGNSFRTLPGFPIIRRLLWGSDNGRSRKNRRREIYHGIDCAKIWRDFGG